MRKKRAKSDASPPFAARSASYHAVVSSLEKIGSLVPW
jgi:hypothetical protein